MRLRWILFCLVALLTSGLAHAKGSPDLIVISGDGLVRPVEITNPASLKQFDPWMGQFADWKKEPVSEPSCYRRSYEVLFYMKWPGRKSPLDRGDLKLIYATRYCFDDSAGYVYLPGRDERNYVVNTGTILRTGRDGRWSRSTPQWDAFLHTALALKEQASQADMIQVSGGNLGSPIQITDAELLRSFEPWSARFIDWENPRDGSVLCGWEYEVSFFRRGVDKKTTYDLPGYNMIYGLRFCFDETSHAGWIHLAGGGDIFGSENRNNVWDARHAGRWYAATPEWDRVVKTALRSSRAAGQ